MISKADHFREHVAAFVIGGFDAADFADGGGGAFRFDDETDQLNHAPAGFSDVRAAHAAERGS